MTHNPRELNDFYQYEPTHRVLIVREEAEPYLVLGFIVGPFEIQPDLLWVSFALNYPWCAMDPISPPEMFYRVDLPLRRWWWQRPDRVTITGFCCAHVNPDTAKLLTQISGFRPR